MSYPLQIHPIHRSLHEFAIWGKKFRSFHATTGHVFENRALVSECRILYSWFMLVSQVMKCMPCYHNPQELCRRRELWLMEANQEAEPSWRTWKYWPSLINLGCLRLICICTWLIYMSFWTTHDAFPHWWQHAWTINLQVTQSLRMSILQVIRLVSAKKRWEKP